MFFDVEVLHCRCLTEQLTNLAMDQGEEVNVRRCPVADLVLLLQIIKFKKYSLNLINLPLTVASSAPKSSNRDGPRE